MSIIRSISGLRATLSDGSLSDNLITKYASAFHQFCPEGHIVIGRDGRPSGKKIEKLLFSAFQKLNRNVNIIGIVPSPTVQFITETENAAGGISITASHNPDDWNGLKFINAEGIFLDAEENTKLWKIFDELSDNEEFELSSLSEEEILASNSNAFDSHINSVLNLRYVSDIIDDIRKNNFKVVVDAVNASGSKIVPKLLREFGCNVIPLYCDESGIFPHLPEPLPVNLTALASRVKDEHADLGISVDPDADRLVLIDENGNPIGEENTIVLSVWSVMSYLHGKSNPVAVVNHSTTQGVEYITKKFGGSVARSAVGEINVVKQMISLSAVIGGEGSGGVILPECHYGRDSLVGISLILSLLTRTNKTLSQLRQAIPNYSMIKDKFHFEGDFAELRNKVKNIFSDCSIIEEDGLKFIFPSSWVQIRKSNTEPIVRIIAEAIERNEVEMLISKIKSEL
ncbi:MAG: hypothetical protein A2X64_09540 [Ignavibacteria bacterium GWF2_33_9]|nr:MAG: hypothetical protein A2X64_09540 [Ignavibacteria bacterium GWF2_33_9]